MVKGADYGAHSACYPRLSRHMSDAWNGWLSRKAVWHPAASESYRSYATPGIVPSQWDCCAYCTSVIGPFILVNNIGNWPIQLGCSVESVLVLAMACLLPLSLFIIVFCIIQNTFLLLLAALGQVLQKCNMKVHVFGCILVWFSQWPEISTMWRCRIVWL